MVSEDDFKDLLRVVRVIRDNLQLNDQAFRHTQELNASQAILDRLLLRYGIWSDEVTG